MNNINISIFKEERRGHGDKTITAVNQEKKKIGYASYNFCSCELIFMEVDKEYRRQGVGTQLFQAAMKDLQSFGCERMKIDVSKKNITDVLPFFLQQGVPSPLGLKPGSDNYYCMSKPI